MAGVSASVLDAPFDVLRTRLQVSLLNGYKLPKNNLIIFIKFIWLANLGQDTVYPARLITFSFRQADMVFSQYKYKGLIDAVTTTKNNKYVDFD